MSILVPPNIFENYFKIRLTPFAKLNLERKKKGKKKAHRVILLQRPTCGLYPQTRDKQVRFEPQSLQQQTPNFHFIPQ